MALKRQPMNIDKNNWYYEEIKGIYCVHQVLDDKGNYLKTETWYIPWKRLLESVRRKYGAPIK
jgi:hypothetical protein